MMTLKTFAYSFVLLQAISIGTVEAQVASSDSIRKAEVRSAVSAPRVQGVQYASRQEAAEALAAQSQLPLIAGVSVSADVAGAVMAAFTPYGQYEAAARLNMRGRYFPIVEVGMGVSNHTNETTKMHYKVHAPYWRLGMDYNVLKNARSGNRVFVGLRYGFSTYKYSLDGPDLVDPNYGTSQPFCYSNLRGTNHWAEAVFGLEARVWGILHLGWSFRYRMRLSDKKSVVGSPWYVPGFGKNDTSALGGTFNVIFDI